MKFPHDAPLIRAIKTFERLGFVVVRSGNHISLKRFNADGSTTPLTIPGHTKIKGSTLRMICTQAGIAREVFITACEQSG